MTIAAGTRLGPYEIRGLLGAGGMGEVYRAFDPRLGREVAVKVLPEEMGRDPERLARFEREARAVAALNHPNILTVHDVGTHEAVPYVVTELLEGETLRELMSRRAPTQRQVLSLAVQAARGLEAAHAKGILHRDLKPENLFVTTDGRLKILDFGLARILSAGIAESQEATTSSPSRPGQLLGTVAYMSPEQVRGRGLDARSDLFSLGVVLYEALGGKHPFLRETPVATLTAILEDEPTPLSAVAPTVSPALGRIVGRCLEKAPEDRLGSAHDLAVALETILAGVPGPAPPPGIEEKSPYPGLFSFTEKDAAFFFGREDEVETLWGKLRARRLLALIGPSGVGKTSFLRAGVVPARGEGWAALVCTPGASPFRSLGQALAPALASDPEALRMLVNVDDPAAALELASRWRRAHAEALLVVDQFEELFTLGSRETQVSFAALLGRLAREADVHVLLSMRDDFLIRCSEQPPLASVFESLTPLAPLSGEALRRAVEAPAGKRGCAFEEALVEEMVESVEGVRGALPLLAFAVAQLWEKRDREKRRLTREAYREIGGVAGALAGHAEATLERIGAERHAVVREIFRNLVTAQGTRAAADREELLSVFPERRSAEEVLETLIDARLLTSYETAAEQGDGGFLGRHPETALGMTRHRIEIVHESLLAAWPRLVWWQAQDEEGAHLRDQLKQAAHLWEEKGRSPDVLWSGTAFREFELWRERYAGKLTALEEDFARSMTERARRRKRLRRLVAGSVVAAAVIVATVTGALWKRSEAAAERAEAGRLVALGRAELDRYPTAAVAYARKSLEIADTPEGRRLAVDALWRSPTPRILPLGSEVVWRGDFSPDGRWFAGYAFGGHLVFVPEDGGPVRIVPGPTKVGNPPWIRFTADGTAVLTKPPEEACVRLSSVPDGREIRRFDPVPPAVRGAVAPPSAAASLASLRWAALPQGLLFWWVPGPTSPGARVPYGLWPYDGGPPTRVGSWPAGTYSVDRGGSRLLARRGRGLFLRPLFAGESALERLVTTLDDVGALWFGLGFSPRGDQSWSLQVKNEIPRLFVWPIGPEASPEPRVFSVPNPDGNFVPAWDPAGTRLALGSSAEKTVWLWDLADPPDAAATTLRRPDMMVTKGAIFTPNRDWLAVMHQGTLTFWALAQPRARVLTGSGVTKQLVFTRDSQSLLSCGDNEVRLWPLAPEGGAARRVAPGFRGWCNGAALAPDGRRLVLVGTNGVWLAPSPESEGRWLMEGDAGFPYTGSSAAWDASGQRIAAASMYAPMDPQSVFLFDSEGANERRLLLTPPGEAGGAFDWGVHRLAFTPDGRLVVGGSGGVRWLDTDTGASRWIWRLPREIAAWIAVSADGRRLVAAAQARDHKAAPAHGVVLVDLASGALQPLLSHGRTVTAVALDASGRTVVTGDEEGALRVGPADGSEPHRLCCHAGRVETISVSPDGKWIASASGGEIRLWPMPDVTKPPLHTLPHDELMAKLRALTNLQVVEDAASPTGYKLDIGPFPGWKDVPTW